MVDTSAFDKDRKKTRKVETPSSYPLTFVPFHVAKHRALKAAKAKAAEKGLPPPKSAALYIDMATVRNFEYYEDIGKTPNDPVAKDMARRAELETVEEKRLEEARIKARKDLYSQEASDEALAQRKQRAVEAKLEEEQRRALEWVETSKRIKESAWQSTSAGDSSFVIRGPMWGPGKHVASELDDHNGVKKKVFSSVSEKENMESEEECTAAIEDLLEEITDA